MLEGVQRFVARHFDLVLFSRLIVHNVDGDGIALGVPAEDDLDASVIRAALDQYTREHVPPRPRLPLFSSGKPITDWDEAMRGFGED